MAINGKLIVFVELPGGELDETGRGLLSYAARMAKKLDCSWKAVTATRPDSRQLEVFGSYGTPAITMIADGETLLDTPTRLGACLARYAVDETAGAVLFPHNDLGNTLAPIVAHGMDAAIVTELLSVAEDADAFKLSRKALGVRVAETRTWDGAHSLVATIPLRSLSQVLLATVTPATPSLDVWKPETLPGNRGVSIVKRIPPDPQTVDLSDAEVIFSAGKGCDQTTFEQMKELCRLLNVSFGVTRPVYDLGWTGFERMVGQTGRTVTPRLYVALGISGSMHHVGGIKDSRRIVSVNLDSKAPIFPNSDEGFVADLKELLPCLLKQVKAQAGGKV